MRNPIHLKCTTGGSNKEYRLSIVPSGNLFNVVALWGAIGSALRETVKGDGLSEEEADKMFDKIVKGQIGKGYVAVATATDGQAPGAQLAVVTAGQPRQVITRLLPQLCEAIPYPEGKFDHLPAKEAVAAAARFMAEPYILDDRWAIEPKWDGKRRPIIKAAENLTAGNRHGQATNILPALQARFAEINGDCSLDTEDEVVGNGCIILDATAMRNKPTDRLSGDARRKLLEDFAKENGIEVARPDKSITRPLGSLWLTYRAVGAKAKRELVEWLIAHNCEGFIGKLRSAVVVPGEAGRGDWVKGKLWKTATVIVARHNVKRSFDMCVFDGIRRVHVGSCTVPPNREVPAVNTAVEVRYLYARRGGSLFQSKFLQDRSDEYRLDADDATRELTVKACAQSQLIYKQGEE